MLPEQRATSYAHDPAKGTVVVVTEHIPKTRLQGEQPGRLLLDTTAHLVGVDVAPDAPERVVVMLGPHENVVRVEEVRVHVEDGGRTIALHGTAAKLVAPGASPYVP